MEQSIPTLQQKSIRLRPVVPDDYSMLFAWHHETENLYLWWMDRYILDFDNFVNDFRRRLNNSFHTFFVIEKHGDQSAPIGMIYTYNPNFIDGFVYLCIYLHPKETGKGLGLLAGTLLCDYLFAYYNFRKIYSEIFAYNAPSLKAATRNGFKEEGRLKHHRWFNGQHWDLIILALYRESFASFKSRVFEQFSTVQFHEEN